MHISKQNSLPAKMKVMSFMLFFFLFRIRQVPTACIQELIKA